MPEQQLSSAEFALAMNPSMPGQLLSSPEMGLWLLEQNRRRVRGDFETLHEWNPAPANYPRNLCLHQIFERQVKAHPNRVAVIAGDEEISYDELNRRANKLARVLIDAGVKDQDFVTCFEP